MLEAAAISSGTHLGPYIVVEKLGQGASATVYLAHDADGNAVALKVRQRGAGAEDRRFLREFEAMRALRLPGVVRVYEAGLEDDLLWFSMELVWGRPFLEVIHEEKFAGDRVRRTVKLGRQLMETLEGLHRAGFIHRDVKPSNVLVDKGGKVHVLDFGISRFFEQGPEGTGETGQALGTIPYMSPEQLAGLPHDRSVDLFAAGVMLYESVAGQREAPRTAVGWISKTCLERLTPLACKRKQVPRAFSDLVERMTAVDPSARPSAEEAVTILDRIREGKGHEHWPEPTFLDPGDWWLPLEGALGGRPEHATYWILEGQTGSGRRRIAEQVHRTGLMEGVWPLHAYCRVSALGGPIETVLRAVLRGAEDEAWCRQILEERGAVLRRMWPQLPLPGVGAPASSATLRDVADAAARTIGAASTERRLLIILHAVEHIDELTARTVQRLAAHARPAVGLVLLHDPRWRTSLSTQLLTALRRRHGAGQLTVPKFEDRNRLQLAALLAPDASRHEVGGSLPQHAVEAGLETLAAWRGEEYRRPDNELWPLAVLYQPVPRPVAERLLGDIDIDRNPWIRSGPDGLSLSGEFARRAIRCRIGNLRAAAKALAQTWVEVLGEDERVADLATLRLLSGDRRGAWVPAARAALAAARLGRYTEARRWLFLLDSLPAESIETLAFDLALTQARVALTTESGDTRMGLVDAAERLASSPGQEQAAKVLRAEYELRAGSTRSALVTALRVASPSMRPTADVAVRALVVATRCRTLLGQFDGVAQQVERARALLAGNDLPELEGDVAIAEVDALLAQHHLDACDEVCRQTLDRASARGDVRIVAHAAARLGRVLRYQGRRRESERHFRLGLEAVRTTGDVALEAETQLSLAAALVERGDSARARNLIDESLRAIRGLRLDHFVPLAMRVVLQTAIALGNTTDAEFALRALGRNRGVVDSEAAAVMVRWWRIRGDIDRALEVGSPEERTYGHALWRLERARAALVGNRGEIAVQECEAGLLESTVAGFPELQTYARLLRGTIVDPGESTWNQIMRKASGSLLTEVYLGALEMDARRLASQGRLQTARTKWRTLRARSEELGYEPGVQEAAGWLGLR